MKQILYQDEARNKLKEGVRKLTKAVASTMSASGSNCIIDTETDQAFITGDGITVAENYETDVAFESIGVSLVKKVCRHANMRAGDGTTTACVLANSFLENDYVIKPTTIKRKALIGMKKAIEDVKRFIEENAKQVETDVELENIATVSARGDVEMGKLIASAFKHSGKEGQIVVEEGRNTNSSVEHITGYNIDGGYTHPAFITNTHTRTCEYKDSLIFVTDIPLLDAQDMAAVLKIAMEEERSIVLIAPEISLAAETVLVSNNMHGVVKSCFIKAPSFGEKQDAYLRDLAYLSGGVFFSSREGYELKKVDIKHLGECEKVVIAKEYSVFFGLEGQKDVKEYCAIMSPIEDERFQKNRKARLEGKVSKIIVGANSDIEMREKRDRVEDAVNAAKAALEQGYIIGGGMALLYAMVRMTNNLTDAHEKVGYELVMDSLVAPATQILFNLFRNEDAVEEMLQTLIEGNDMNIGYDVSEMEITNLYERGIIDPIKVTISALEAAFSIASEIINTDCIIAVVGENFDLEL